MLVVTEKHGLFSAPVQFSALLCIHLRLYSYRATIGLALAIWLMGPLPLTITNVLFIKLTPAFATADALGWLVKLCIAAIAAVVILG
jgi:hypothetical protein